ncbi:Cytochrome_b5-like_Heme/Steroid_binding_domain_containing_protein [Leishmania braziliensis MHOM/BR/75/M2904]|uniref:Cytochrome_b5-like_Heme/Steroid_binding_domain_co ntaining_protein n=1 Tax=Leishmania braziliensis MHOM/BR/75/M2904 TaxID=420245 RepID=A0A3P3Z9J6_LEIBR|nr:Cytochrome_b5-like_Heme/Steroid_binding_domain_containing_protein [Leishmania braziliensis MHOM/BR/75/M2904]
MSTPSLVITASTPTVAMHSPSLSTVSSVLGTPREEAYPRPLTSSFTHTPSPSERSLISLRSPSLQLSSATVSFAAPLTPSHWMVHDPPSAEKAPVFAPLPAAATTTLTSPLHYSSAEATSDPPLPQHPHPRALATMGAVALHDVLELEKVNAQLFATGRGPSQKWAPHQRSTASLTAPALEAETATAGAPYIMSHSSVSTEAAARQEEHFPKSSPLSPFTFAHPLPAGLNAESDAHESTRQRVRSGSQPVASSSQYLTRRGAPRFSTPTSMIQRCHTAEDVQGKGHGSHNGDQHTGVYRKAPPLPPPPSRTLSPMPSVAAAMSGGFSPRVRILPDHHRGLGSDVSVHLSMSPPDSGHMSPEQEDPQGFPVLYPSLSVYSSRARTESVMGDDDRGISGGRSTGFSKFGSFSSSTNIANSPRLSMDDFASRLSPSIAPSTARNTPVDLIQKSPQQHLSHNYPQSHSSASTSVHNVPAYGHEPPTSGADVLPVMLASHASLRCSGAIETCVCGSGLNSANGQSPTAPASATALRDATFTSATSSVASLMATATCVVSHPIAQSSSGNLTAPMSCSPTYPSWSPGVSLGHSTPCLQDDFVMRADAEIVQGLPRGKVPRLPGCSIRDWAAHLRVKEEELLRQEQHHHHDTLHCGKNRDASLLGGAAPPAKPGSMAISRNARLPRIAPQEVATHNTPDDLWIVIRNVVYDCTAFQRYHPGGEKLLLACGGRDATAVYDRFHAWVSCESFMAPYAVGVIASSEPR